MTKIIIASGPVIVENNKVLLDKDKKEDLWKFCGGRVKDNEDLIETAKRSAQEELGIDIEIMDDNPFLMYVKREVKGEIKDILLVHYLAKRISEINPGEKTEEWNWFSFDEMPKTTAPNIIPTLKYFNFIK